MAQREAMVTLTADLAGAVERQCRREGVSGTIQRLATVNRVMNTFVLLARKVNRNLDDYGEITPQTFREIRETVRDLAADLSIRADMPGNDAGTSLVAD